MNHDLAMLVLACLAFTGSHFLLSSALLRGSLVKALGPRGFLAAYSVVAFAAIGWMALAFDRTEVGEALWDGAGPLPWFAASVLTLVATALVIASLSGNPALPQAQVAGLSARKPQGVFTVTRHPMMIGIALWALAHAIVAPTARTLVLTGAIALLALGGSHLQDLRKQRELGREWRAWMSRTRFWPDLTRLGHLGGAWAIALVVWLALTALHLYAAGIPAGLFILLR